MGEHITEFCDYCNIENPRMADEAVEYDNKLFCDEMCRFAYIGNAAMKSPEEAMKILDRNKLFVKKD